MPHIFGDFTDFYLLEKELHEVMTSHLTGLLFAIQAMSLLDAEPVFFRTQASIVASWNTSKHGGFKWLSSWGNHRSKGGIYTCIYI
jgi:hypothetical protein